MSGNGSGLSDNDSSLSLGRLASLACLLEVTASKPGNVHRGADFEDVGFIDFGASGIALGQAIDDCHGRPFGETVLQVARNTKQVSDSNTNLGMNLLISLLAKVIETAGMADVSSVRDYVQAIPAGETANLYEAIRLMNPSGLQSVAENDVGSDTDASIFEVMNQAAGRDLVARQFVNGCQDVFEKVLPWLVEGQSHFRSWTQAIVWAHVRMMADTPDALIARKLGEDMASQSQTLALKAVDGLAGGLEEFWARVGDLDFWLRSDGHRRNPGTSADLVAAGLFFGLYNQTVTAPFA